MRPMIQLAVLAALVACAPKNAGPYASAGTPSQVPGIYHLPGTTLPDVQAEPLVRDRLAAIEAECPSLAQEHMQLVCDEQPCMLFLWRDANPEGRSWDAATCGTEQLAGRYVFDATLGSETESIGYLVFQVGLTEDALTETGTVVSRAQGRMSHVLTDVHTALGISGPFSG